MVDILLINSPLFKEKIENYSEDSLPPLGLGYLTTELKKKRIDVNLLDSVLNNVSLEELISVVEITKPKFIGLNIFSTNFHLVQELVERVKSKNHFLIGGQVTKSTYKKIINFNTENTLDVVIGEGEYVTPDILLDNLKEKPHLSKDGRRVFRIDGNSIYFPRDISGMVPERSFFKNEPATNKFGYNEANIITSRGCMYNCAFCGAARSLNRDIPIRIRSEESIRKEVMSLIDLYPGLESIRVLDDLFLRSVKDIESAGRIFEHKLYWRTMAHALSFKKAQKTDFKNLSRNGCNEVFMGIESGSLKILKRINKLHDLNYLQKTVIHLLNAGINVKGYFIFGFPEETESEMNKTYNLAYKLKKESEGYSGSFMVSVFQFRPYHGTILYEQIDKGMKNLKFDRNKKINLQGRLQFNFHAGNFSNASDEIIESYVQRTMGLNQK